MTHPTDPAAFEGRLLRGAQWRDASYDDLRVAVLAPGHQAARIVPSVARTARSVKVFQEGPDWLVPLALPLPGALARPVARLHLKLTVHDRWLRRRLTPDARFNRRRPWVDRRYYAALEQPNCTLISWPVYAIVPGGVRSAEGIEHHVDCIVLASGSVFAERTTQVSPTREESSA